MTALMYLATPEEGGETVFPDAAARGPQEGLSECARGGLANRPVKGDMLMFYSLTPGGEPDESSLHASCPTLKGVGGGVGREGLGASAPTPAACLVLFAAAARRAGPYPARSGAPVTGRSACPRRARHCAGRRQGTRGNERRDCLPGPAPKLWGLNSTLLRLRHTPPPAGEVVRHQVDPRGRVPDQRG